MNKNLSSTFTPRAEEGEGSVGGPNVARFANFGIGMIVAAIPYGFYVSRLQEQVVSVRELLYAPRSQMLDVKHRGAVKA